MPEPKIATTTSTTLSDVHQALEKTYLSLTAMQFSPGPRLDAFLKEAQVGVFQEVQLVGN